MSGPLDGNGKDPLMPGTDAGLSLGFYLVPVGDIAPESTYLFVIDDRCLLHAKSTYLAPGHITAPLARLGRSGPSPVLSCSHDWTITSISAGV